MNREFEFKQILRAYRGGIIGEAAFEQEMARLETGGAPDAGGAPPANGANGAGFRAFGRIYKSERAAVVSFLDKVCAGEANGAEAFRRWAEVCTAECIRSALRTVAEREAYHARVFECRMRDLGAERRASATEEGRRFTTFLADPKRTDGEKLMEFVRAAGDADAAVKPIHDFAALLIEDLETKEALRLFAEDEHSTVKWAHDACAALNAGGPAVAARSTAPARPARANAT
jgi:Rubrerythrin